MHKILANFLSDDGMRHMRIIGDKTISQAQVQRMVPLEARAKVEFAHSKDEALDLHSLDMAWPVFEPYEVAIHGPKKFRRLMFVHFSYATRVSDCIGLARNEYFSRTRFAPLFAFVQSVPDGKDGELVHDCVLLGAEWMPARCVAIGGHDG